MENSSVWTELFARDNCEPRSKNANDAHRWHLQKFGGKILARGGKFKILEGPEKFHRFVVIEFPSFEKALACHESAEYVRPRRTARRTARAS
jgi:uncharacterized protein (DUF1330 family)